MSEADEQAPPVPAAAGTVLEAHGLQKRFGAVVAASDIHVTVPTGARLSLIGANGAGKTTFVNMVTGYLKPDAGRITLAGRDITALGPRQITRLGVCRSFQIPQLCEPMTPLENLLVAVGAGRSDHGGAAPRGLGAFFGAARSGAALAAAHAMLARFELQDYADQPVNELPGGVRKLIDIAMALARRPRVLLLDEPTSGVSTEEKFPLMDRVMAALAGTDGEEVAVLFVEHDMDIVTRYADRVLAFYAGEIIADDAPDEVLSDPAVQKYVTGTARGNGNGTPERDGGGGGDA
ncbi:ABC transporter ATP-binding protein [Marinibaculum pumilum]|uniref:ABC transporter ATP-binding protein n=1 Tax=Marinibaculum pumilum TaxID=1766165 RepID=A0ABV7KZS1_9PROT